MDNDKDKIEVTPEEQTAEQEALKGVTVDEIKDKLADEMGLDPEADADLIDKLAKRELSHREKLSGAIKQKISWREKLKSSQTKTPDTPAKGKSQTLGQEDVDRLVDEKLNARLEARELEELGLPEELESELKKLAKINGTSVRKAAQDPYFIYKKKEYEEAERIKNATPTRKGRGSYQQSYDPSKPLNPADFDLSTKEGREEWNNAKAARQKHLSGK